MASVTYSIKGKYDGKAVKQAQNGFTALSNQIKNINALVSGFAAFKVVQQLKNIAQEGMQSFVSQNAALSRFNTAVSKTNLSLSKLQTIQNKVSHNNLFDGDAINDAMTLATNLGLDEEQMEKVMDAATNMAASGVMPLDQAVKALSLSYSGNITQLKKIAPELGDLTTKQIENGKAVDLLVSKYAGFADAMANTFSGRNTQWDNSISDLKSAIGSIPESLKFLSEGKLLEPLNNVTNWIVSNRDYILNFIINLPSVINAAFNLVKNMIAQTFTGDTIINVITAIIKTTNDAVKNVWEYIGNIADNYAVIFVNVITDLASTIKEKLTNAFTDATDGFNNVLLETLSNFFQQVVKVIDYIKHPVKGVIEITASIINGKKTVDAERANGASASDINSKYFGQIAQNTTDFAKNFKNNLAELGGTINDNYKEQIDAFISEMENILGQELPEDLKSALEGLQPTTTDNSGTTINNNTSSILSDMQNGFTNLLSSLGELGTIIKDIISADWIGIIVTLLSGILAQLSEESNSIEILFNIVTELIAAVIDIIVPAMDSLAYAILGIFTPVADILKSILEIVVAAVNGIMPIINLLVEIISSLAPAITAIVELAVIIVDLAGVIIGLLEPIFIAIEYMVKGVSSIISIVANTIGNCLIGLYNVVVWIYNALDKYLNSSKNQKSFKDYYNYTDSLSKIWGSVDTSAVDELLEAANNASSSSSSTSSSASYTAAKDIYVNVYYEHSFVNGDAREIAIAIRDEIRTAEKLGY